MKRTGLILTCIILFAISLYSAYLQGVIYVEVNVPAGGHLATSFSATTVGFNPFWANYAHAFSTVLNTLSGFFFNSLIAAIVVLALLLELITLYPSVNLQLKQKKIHLFHKKLVDRFQSGDLAMSDSKRELDVLYSVNERTHRRGALLFCSQLIVFILVVVGLNLVAQVPSTLLDYINPFNIALLSSPIGISLPILASLAYMLHSLVKIHLKQKEDYISMKQLYMSFALFVIISGMVFYFAVLFPVLLTVFFLTQISFSTIRYIIVESKTKDWGNYVQKELIKMLKSAKVHKNKMEHWSRVFNHIPIVRYLNFHMMEEALSMSLAIVMAFNGLMIM